VLLEVTVVVLLDTVVTIDVTVMTRLEVDSEVVCVGSRVSRDTAMSRRESPPTGKNNEAISNAAQSHIRAALSFKEIDSSL